jgi:hypothetical protein
MPLVSSSLSAQMYAAYQKQQSRGASASLDELCSDLATAIDTYIKSGLVSTTETGVANGGIGLPGGPISGAVGVGTGTGSMS